jgi:hypothetical protein
LLDQSYLTTGYPELIFSGGKGASVRIRYAETLYTSKKPINKGNRNDVEEKSIFGFADEYVADGGRIGSIDRCTGEPGGTFSLT